MRTLKEERRWTNVGNLHIHPLLRKIEIYNRSDKLVESIKVDSLELRGVDYASYFYRGNLDTRTACQVVFPSNTILVLYEGEHLSNIEPTGRKSR